jgi:hypothetical protein
MKLEPKKNNVNACEQKTAATNTVQAQLGAL